MKRVLKPSAVAGAEDEADMAADAAVAADAVAVADAAATAEIAATAAIAGKQTLPPEKECPSPGVALTLLRELYAVALCARVLRSTLPWVN